MPSSLESIPWARRLKLRHLEVLVALHDSGSLTAAGTRLHMTQPALSHWLADLEEAVGRQLFVRGRRLSLTEEGAVLYAHAARMLGDVERTHADLQAVASGLSGRLHIGTGLPRVLLPMAIERLHQDRPNVFVSVVEAPLPELLDKLAKREIDLIIGALSGLALQSGFATEALFSDRVEVVARREHPLVGRAKLSWQETLGYPWILPPGGSVMRDVVDQAFAAQGLQPPIPCVEANSSIRTQLLMSERNYVSILAASEVDLYRPMAIVEGIPLAPPMLFPDIGAIWEAERCSGLVMHLLDLLRAGEKPFGG
jgi:DNA-binding transcriptional LysR family regulator